jgi:hypothetical protein
MSNIGYFNELKNYFSNVSNIIISSVTSYEFYSDILNKKKDYGIVILSNVLSIVSVLCFAVIFYTKKLNDTEIKDIIDQMPQAQYNSNTKELEYQNAEDVKIITIRNNNKFMYVDLSDKFSPLNCKECFILISKKYIKIKTFDSQSDIVIPLDILMTSAKEDLSQDYVVILVNKIYNILRVMIYLFIIVLILSCFLNAIFNGLVYGLIIYSYFKYKNLQYGYKDAFRTSNYLFMAPGCLSIITEFFQLKTLQSCIIILIIWNCYLFLNRDYKTN